MLLTRLRTDRKFELGGIFKDFHRPSVQLEIVKPSPSKKSQSDNRWYSSTVKESTTLRAPAGNIEFLSVPKKTWRKKRKAFKKNKSKITSRISEISQSLSSILKSYEDSDSNQTLSNTSCSQRSYLDDSFNSDNEHLQAKPKNGQMLQPEIQVSFEIMTQRSKNLSISHTSQRGLSPWEIEPLSGILPSSSKEVACLVVPWGINSRKSDSGHNNTARSLKF